MKKFFAVICFIMLNALAMNAAITVTIGSVSAVSGGTATIPVTISGANGSFSLWGIEMRINYDNTKISTSGGSFSDFSTSLPSSNWLGNLSYNTNTIFQTYTHSTLDNVSVPDNTVMFNIQVTYTGSTTTNVTFDLSNSETCFIIDNNGNNLNVTWVNGSVSPQQETLNAPTLSTPANNATNLSRTPDFSWSSVNNATSYTLQVSTNSSFTSNVIDQTITTTSYTPTSNLNYNTQYFWRAKALNNDVESGWSQVRNFTTLSESNVQCPWTVTQTDNNHTIIIPTNISPTVAGRAFQNGDAVGFFYNRSGQLVCGGFATWNGSNMGFSIWGNDQYTPTKDGFDVGENFNVKVWDYQAGVERDANLTYRQGDPTTYQVNGITRVTSLDAPAEITIDLNLTSGWNMISSWVTPQEPDMSDVFADIDQYVVVAKNGQGQLYYPEYSINGIGNWNIAHGYQVYITQASTLQIYGLEAEPNENPLYLPQGWNIIGYIDRKSVV